VPVRDRGAMTVSTSSNSQSIRASTHVVNRFIQRVGWVTQTDIEHRFRNGCRVDVKNKVYTEARLIEINDAQLILLRKGTNITTVLYASKEEVRKLGQSSASNGGEAIEST
jgi:hypothetical protein